MLANFQMSQRSGICGKVKCTPLQGTKYAKRCDGVPAVPRHKNLEDRPQDNSTPKVTDEKEDAVVRIFYTYRGTPESDISVWYADGEFGNREEVPQPVATLDATHVEVKFLKQSGLCPKVDLWTFVMDPEKGRRPIYMDEFIETVIHDVEYEWSESLPKALTEWELIFPKGESWGIVQIIGCVDSPGPSIREIKKSPTV